MYNNVVVYSDSGLKSYTVTDNENIFNGYVSDCPVSFYTCDEDGYYRPSTHRNEFSIRKTTVKPSIYKRGFLQCRKENEYRYAFTERTSRSVVTDKDVYYNANKNRFISRSKTSSLKKVEYSLPYTFIW